MFIANSPKLTRACQSDDCNQLGPANIGSHSLALPQQQRSRCIPPYVWRVFHGHWATEVLAHAPKPYTSMAGIVSVQTSASVCSFIDTLVCRHCLPGSAYDGFGQMGAIAAAAANSSSCSTTENPGHCNQCVPLNTQTGCTYPSCTLEQPCGVAPHALAAEASVPQPLPRLR